MDNSYYTNGLEDFLKRLGSQHPEFINVLTLQDRLLNVLHNQSSYGDDPSYSSERARIIDELNRLSMQLLNISYNELCRLKAAKNSLAIQLPLRIPSRSLGYFVGRGKELRTIKRYLRNKYPQNIALCGMGGIGKTTLARKIVDDLEKEYPGGVLWADFSAHQGDPLVIIDSWSQIFSKSEIQSIRSTQIRAQVLAGVIEEYVQSQGKVIAVFDDVRQTEAYSWLDGAHLLRLAIPNNIPVILTTREVEVAQSFRAKTIPVDILQTEEAVSLLLQLLPGQDIDIETAVELVEAVGNLPLAAEVVAGLIQSEGLEWVIEKLIQQQKLVETLHVGDLRSKADNVLISFQLSFSCLPDHIKQLFQVLGTFASGYIKSEWVAGVLSELDGSKCSVEKADASLRVLYHRGLLSKVDNGFRLHPLVHDYASSVLKMDEQKQNVLNSYSHFFLSRTRELSSKFIELSEIYENSANAANIALENRKWEEYKDFVLNIAIFERYLYTRGFWVDALKYLRKGLNVANELDDKPTLAILEWNIGTLQREMGNYDEAIDSFDLAMKISIDLKDDYGLASALMGKGYVLLYSADYKNGGVVFQAAVQNSISSKNKMALGEALRGLGRISISLGEINRALEYLYQSEPILREMNNYQGLSYNFRALGEAYGILSKTDTKYISLSFDCFEKGLKIAEQIGDPQAQAYIIRGQGDVYTLHGSIEKAIECYKKSELLFISVGDRASLAATLCSIGEAYLDIQELDLANTYCSQAKGLAFTMSLPRWQGRSLFLQAKIQFEMGSNQEALELARRAKKLLKKIGHRDEQLVNQWIKKILDEKKE